MEENGCILHTSESKTVVGHSKHQMVKKGLCLPHPGELWGLIYLFDCTINLPSTIHVRKPFNKNFNSLNLKLCQTARTGGGYVPPLGLRLLGDLGMMMGWQATRSILRTSFSLTGGFWPLAMLWVVCMTCQFSVSVLERKIISSPTRISRFDRTGCGSKGDGNSTLHGDWGTKTPLALQPGSPEPL